MKIVLRILIVLLLVLSGVSLFLGINLFLQREQLKGRIHRLEDHTVDMSKYVETEEANDLAQRHLQTGGITKKELKKYYKIDPVTGKPAKQMDQRTQKMVKITKGSDTMDYSLDLLLKRSYRQWQILDETRIDLQDTRDNLAETKDKLRRAKAEIASLNTTAEELRDDVADLKDEVSDNLVTIDTKEEQISDLNNQVSVAEEEILKLQEDQYELESVVDALKKYIAELKEEIERLKAEEAQTFVPITSGYKGKVLQVNPDWNFVVIGLAKDSKVTRGIELLIQRNKKLVGKVTVTKVKTEENKAIAEILPQWQQMPLQKGDLAVYHR